MKNSIEINLIEDKMLDVGCKISIIRSLGKVIENIVTDNDNITQGDINNLLIILNERIQEMYTILCNIEEILHI